MTYTTVYSPQLVTFVAVFGALKAYIVAVFCALKEYIIGMKKIIKIEDIKDADGYPVRIVSVFGKRITPTLEQELQIGRWLDLIRAFFKYWVFMPLGIITLIAAFTAFGALVPATTIIIILLVLILIAFVFF